MADNEKTATAIDSMGPLAIAGVEPEDVNKENMSIAEMSGKKLDWFRKVCAAVL